VRGVYVCENWSLLEAGWEEDLVVVWVVVVVVRGGGLESSMEGLEGEVCVVLQAAGLSYPDAIR